MDTYDDCVERMEFKIDDIRRDQLLYELYALVAVEAKFPPSGELFADRVRASGVPEDHLEDFILAMKKLDVLRVHGAFWCSNTLMLDVVRDGQAIRERKNKQRWHKLMEALKQ